VHIRLPSSRASFRVRFSPVDVALAAVAPLVALYLRNGATASGGWTIVASYSIISLVFSLVAFQVFHVSDSIHRYISVTDLLDIAKVALSGQLMTTVLLFTVTRLNGIPRSVPAIQLLVLATGLVSYRALVHLTERRHRGAHRPRQAVSENVIFIGLNDWSVLVLKFLKAQAPKRWRVIALLDEEAQWIGRSVDGAHVFGPPAQLEALIEEFGMHGVRTDRVVVGSEAGALSERALAQVKGVCARRDLDLIFIPELSPLGSVKRDSRSADNDSDRLATRRFLADVPPAPYLRCKRIIDAFMATILILWLLPLLGIAAIAVIFDVGSPVLFWQQRLGQGGRELQIYKLRTLRPPFNRRGQRIPDEQRFSWIGSLLRRTRIDELPQLLNVLVGDMSLIGPRPLLPQDQPQNSAIRLMVRPGITGWAQVNGGASLSATEKEALDVWYICNASLLLDLRILGMTLLSLLKGDRRSEKALAQAQSLRARHLQMMQANRDAQALKQAVASYAPTAGTRDGSREAVAMQSR
jgi:lipopolysaccharide/colanic/teichoic acid biosynthesis glycosyltransferase